MKYLSNLAAISAIIGTGFTVATFYSSESEVIKNNGDHFKDGTKQVPDAEVRQEIQLKYEAALKISLYSDRSFALEKLSRKAEDRGDFNISYTISKSIPLYDVRSDSLKILALKAKERGNIEFATKVAESIPIYAIQSEALRAISEI
ncbi:hypothetical protein [Alteromonas sp. a30]|uniref:hypothetical protein n=1 Tax=Alteromonas sp. a30 TaxID=2730917 RepID=UPI00227DE33F|nr:hypothetical protein [Alteromonas sp. a30]MCY7295581.1 hypothetical protein [Alteromonas sp. a30]